MEDFHFEYSLTSMESQFKMCHFKLFLTHIVKLLNYNDYSRTVSRINIDYKKKFKNIKVLPSMAIPSNFQPSTIFVLCDIQNCILQF